MSTFTCPVIEVDEVFDHPNADRLSLVRLRGLDYTCISAKLEDGSHQYKPGDLAVYIPSAAVLPEWLLKHMGFWNESENKGTLAGSDGNRVKPLKLRGIFSEGILLPVCDGNIQIAEATHPVTLGQNASELLGVVKYEPPIPIHMAGEVLGLRGAPKTFDVENIKNHPNVLQDSDWVHVSEKLHGCLHRNSLVMLPNGEEVSIKNVIEQKYTHVLSFDESSNSYVTRRITGTSIRPNIEKKQWVKLTFENGKYLILTADHPVYSRTHKSWIKAGEVTPNDDIESPIL